MTTFPRLTLVATIALAWSWVDAAPPRVAGNRPVVIDAPISDADDDASRGGDQGEPRAVATVQPGDRDPAEESPDEQQPVGNAAAAELQRARDLILKYASIQAQVVETVSFFDRSYKAEGRYLQTGLKPNDWHMRLELTLKVGNSEGALLEVCDGDVLWTSTQIDVGRKAPRTAGEKESRPDQSIVRRNVKEILDAARKHGDSVEAMLIAELGLGGLPGLLAAMAQDMQFTGMKQDTLRGHSVTIIQGTWSDAFMARLQNPQQRSQSALLPPFVPDSVRLFIDRETGFPHRVLYLKKLPNRDKQRAMLSFDFLNVAINHPIDKSEFAYEPPSGIQPAEVTKLYLDRLKSLDGNSRQPDSPKP